MTLYKELLKLGMKENEMGNWCSDLHVLKNEISTEFVKTYPHHQNIEIFRSEIDKKLWYDIPFAYTEHYKNH